MSINTPAQIIAVLAPQFASDPRLSDLIALATMQTSSTCFGDKYNLAIALRVCHGLALEARNGGNSGTSSSGSGVGGVLTDEKEGDLARSYGFNNSSSGRESELNSTTYGQQLLSLIRQSILCARTRLMSGCRNGTIVS